MGQARGALVTQADATARLLRAREEKEENGGRGIVKSLTFPRDRSGLCFWEVISESQEMSSLKGVSLFAWGPGPAR